MAACAGQESPSEPARGFPARPSGRPDPAGSGAAGRSAAGESQMSVTCSHCFVWADFNTASQTYCVSKASRKVGPAG